MFFNNKLYDLFTPEDQQDLFENACILINAYIKTWPIHYIQPKFHTMVVNSVTKLLFDTIYETVTTTIPDEEVVTMLEDIVKEAIDVFYKYIAPPRSNGTTFIRFKPNVKAINDKLTYLRNIPQPAQRTPEWYDIRSRYLTASSLWKAFMSQSTKNQLIFDKCKPLNMDKYNSNRNVSIESPLHWGHKYEPLSVMFYEKLYSTTISDFGCLPHKTISYLAASPDGINTLESSPRYGRMLEIKNIYNRDITGIPKLEYWVQMQLQMEVCNLNECDFLETRFKEYESKEEFEEDSITEHKGMLILFTNEEGELVYEYGPLHLTTMLEFEDWQDEIMEKNMKFTWLKTIYWKLDELSCVLVLRNKMWFSAMIPQLEEIWGIIQEEKQSGNYLHRAPKKMDPAIKAAKAIKKNTLASSGNDINITMQSTCFIDV